MTQVRLQDSDGVWLPGQVKGKLALQDKGVLKLALVDVQQGDGILLETPSGKVMLIDAGREPDCSAGIWPRASAGRMSWKRSLWRRSW